MVSTYCYMTEHTAFDYSYKHEKPSHESQEGREILEIGNASSLWITNYISSISQSFHFKSQNTGSLLFIIQPFSGFSFRNSILCTVLCLSNSVTVMMIIIIIMTMIKKKYNYKFSSVWLLLNCVDTPWEFKMSLI